jgi:hypothetical protein
MLKFLTSLTFLYLFVITVLFLYGLLYYKNFIRNGYQKRRFPWIFLLIGISCFSFLYFNIHAGLSLKTFSNLDHQFIRHDGFLVGGEIELGRKDTINYQGNSFNRFMLTKKKDRIQLVSSYSEDPFYASSTNTYKILSVTYPAVNHFLSFRLDSSIVVLKVILDNTIELRINNDIITSTDKTISIGISSWNLFKDDIGFINSRWYTNEQLVGSLKNILLLRNDVSKTNSGELKYFLSGRLFQSVDDVKYDGKIIQPGDLAFTSVIANKSTLAWGIGFLNNNRNQFLLNYLGKDSFSLLNRYPVSYPLIEEDKNDWTKHSVNKFLLSDGMDMLQMPSVFREGFLFSAFSGDTTINFSPVLLSYQKDKANKPLQLRAKYLNEERRPIQISNDGINLPANFANFSWLFSIDNSFNWKFGKKTISPATWELLIFGSLLFFFILVFASSCLKPPNKLSWIWQLLTSVTLVLLTTRFFLYWRYKCFPPYEGMDLPSVQQLNSFWNFGIILLVTIVLACLFGFNFLKYLYHLVHKVLSVTFKRSYYNYREEAFAGKERMTAAVKNFYLVKKLGARKAFFLSWFLILLSSGGVTAINNFDPTTSRHLSIVLVLLYFVFIYLSYKYSPLVTSTEESWWRISTGRSLDIIINNPVKVLLSLSLLGLFAFIDIGFAIVFLNYLLFNEVFLCINYAISGLSAGSKKNASVFGILGIIYLLLFACNLIFGPYIFKFILDLSKFMYIVGYLIFAVILLYMLFRILHRMTLRRRLLTGFGATAIFFITAVLFFPKERILKKAANTKYRIDVMMMPVDKAIEIAYQNAKTYEPVIRAAQNQWFINTFIYEKNNPSVNAAGFNLLPHAPQNKGAKYNAQATDLVASRFLIAEHGKWSVLLYVLLLLLPTTLLASFYKLYPDFTNRINNNYPTITTGFSLLNYLLITALLVILAATGRYIFFGQDLPFGSILSKQSILFPSILIVSVVLLFNKIPLEQYPNKRKLLPGAIVFAGLAMLLFFVKPAFNKGKEFGVTEMAKNLDTYIEVRLQPILDFYDTSRTTRRLSMTKKDQLFSDSVRKLILAGLIDDAGTFFSKEIDSYTRSSFTRHLDQHRMLYLDLYSGKPRLSVNDNYFRIEPPPHLQQVWTGNIYGDSTDYNISLWNENDGSIINKRISSYTEEQSTLLNDDLVLTFSKSFRNNLFGQLCLINRSGSTIQLKNTYGIISLAQNDTFQLRNPDRIRIRDSKGNDKLLVIQPDAFMKNYYVNGNRFYSYPMGSDFIWARNFSESISSDYTAKDESAKNIFISLDVDLSESLQAKMKSMMRMDTAYKKDAEYGICIADGNGRVITMIDFIKDLNRPDPNDKAGFNKLIMGENGYVSQSLLRKQIGNINLLRMNPGPGSTLKPIVFAAIASQLNLDWDAFSTEGFSQKQQYFGGEKVNEYDFEKNNGRISTVIDYLRLSDNYYHSNILLLGSYSKRNLQSLLTNHFSTLHSQSSDRWPNFSYQERQYWLNGFANWPGYKNGKADFGSDSSFISVGLFNNFGINTNRTGHGSDKFITAFDSVLFQDAYKRSGFILPEHALFDQKGTGMDKSKPNEVFISSYRGHVKGSSQVMIPPLKMADAFGKLFSQNRNYSLTLNPYAEEKEFVSFSTDKGVSYSDYLFTIREKLFEGMKQALISGTAARLGTKLKDASPYYYYAKTGTTGDEDSKTKSKLFVIIVSKKKVTDPDYNFRKNKFYTIYFTSQNGPVKQNEEFQAEVIKYVEQSPAFNKYMNGKD